MNDVEEDQGSYVFQFEDSAKWKKKNHPLRDYIESRGFIQRRVLFFLYILHFVFYA